MKSKRFFPAVLLVLLTLQLQAQQAGNCIPSYTTKGSESAYKAGERMDFIIHYKFGIIDSDIASASVTLDTVRVGAQKAFHCRVYGETARLYRRMFPIVEDFNSWFSYDNLKPLRFTRNTKECSYTARNRYVYYWDNVESPYIDAELYNNRSDSTRFMDIALKPCTFDLPSLFFFARNIDMSKVKPNIKYPMTFAIDDEVYDVHFIYEGKCVKKVKGLGNIRCLKFYAALLEGEVFKGDYDMELYISDDRNRLPVLFGAPIIIGEVQGRMTGVSGLKYPFDAKID